MSKSHGKSRRNADSTEPTIPFGGNPCTYSREDHFTENFTSPSRRSLSSMRQSTLPTCRSNILLHCCRGVCRPLFFLGSVHIQGIQPRGYLDSATFDVSMTILLHGAFSLCAGLARRSRQFLAACDDAIPPKTPSASPHDGSTLIKTRSFHSTRRRLTKLLLRTTLDLRNRRLLMPLWRSTTCRPGLQSYVDPLSCVYVAASRQGAALPKADHQVLRRLYPP